MTHTATIGIVMRENNVVINMHWETESKSPPYMMHITVPIIAAGMAVINVSEANK